MYGDGDGVGDELYHLFDFVVLTFMKLVTGGICM